MMPEQHPSDSEILELLNKLDWVPVDERQR